MMSLKKLVSWALVGVLAFSAAGCSPSTGPNQSGGTVIGAVAGGLIGSRFGGGGGKVGLGYSCKLSLLTHRCGVA